VELIIILILTACCYPVISLTEGAFRIILGVIFLFIFPGYSLMAAIFPSKNSVSGVERAGFTLVLSVALVALAGLVLNFTPWGIKLTPIYIALSALILILCVIAFIRRAMLPKEDRYQLRFSFKKAEGPKTGKLDRALYICLTVVAVGAVATMAYVIAKPKAQEPFSNFYMLGSANIMENYPASLPLGEQTSVNLGIDNHENQETTYNIKVTIDGFETQSIASIVLADNDTWTDKVAIVPTGVGDHQKVEFSLYKNSETSPYLVLHLWLNVTE
jgi:uncharacterized membrane protein